MPVDWQRDELVLICSALEANGWSAFRASHESAIRVSVLLNEATLVPVDERDASFRSPNSIQRKAYDLVTLLPGYTGRPTKGGQRTREVLADWLSDPEGMRAEAQRIRAGIVESGLTPRVPATNGQDVIEDPGLAATEGAAVETILIRRERSASLRARKLEDVRRAGLDLICGVCSFDFAHTYGARGEGYIEVHHVVPLHVSGPATTRLEDLVLLCANCHRMIHRESPWLTPAQLMDGLH